MITYRSTRQSVHNPDVKTIEDIIFSSLAPDGGLYVPQSWPEVKHIKNHYAYYHELVADILTPFFTGFLSREALQLLCQRSYAHFAHYDIAPIKQIGKHQWLLELFHGPTFAFKDFALQFLAQIFAENHKKVLIIGATSGDTGSAALQAFAQHEHVSVVMLHPHNRVSPLQRKQMTTIIAPHIHNVAIEGSFDDCQDLVKQLLNDPDIKISRDVTAVNSINWLRILAQMPYYFWGVQQLQSIIGNKPVPVIVPTGNFGNVYAGLCAKHMGCSITKLGVATNQNDILARFFQHNDMSIKPVMPSLSPSMDIIVASNFERYLWDLLAKDGDSVRTLMQTFRERHYLPLEASLWQRVQQDIFAGRADDKAQLNMISEVYQETSEIIDPHTACGVYVAKTQMPEEDSLILATAHPAKFEASVKQALGRTPDMPEALQALVHKQEHYHIMPAAYKAVKQFILEKEC